MSNTHKGDFGQSSVKTGSILRLTITNTGLIALAVALLASGCGKSSAGSSATGSGNGDQRFPAEVIDLLHNAASYQRTEETIAASIARPADIAKLKQSADPLLVQLGTLAHTLSVQEREFINGEAQVENLNIKFDVAPERMHTETKEVAHSGYNADGTRYVWYSHESNEVADVDQPEIDAARNKFLNELDYAYDQRFEFVKNIHQLPALLRQIAAERSKRKSSTDVLKINFSTLSLGMVRLKNISAETLHHCLVVVQGQEIPEEANPFGIVNFAGHTYASTNFGPHAQEVSALPSLAIAYVEEMGPGDKFTMPASKSMNLQRIKDCTVTFWSDEVDSGDVSVSDAQQTMQQARKLQQQAVLDQRNNVHASSDNGIITYQVQVYNRCATDPIPVPTGVKQTLAVWPKSAKVYENVDEMPYKDQSVALCAGSKLQFQVQSDEDDGPTPVLVRFAMRDLTPQEMPAFSAEPAMSGGNAVTLPPLSPKSQQMHDAVLKWIQTNPTVKGTGRNSIGKTFPLTVVLKSEGDSGVCSGTISDGATSKFLRGRIIDDAAQGPTVMFIETNWAAQPANIFYQKCGLAYFLHVQDVAAPHLEIQKATYGDQRGTKSLDVTDIVRALLQDDSISTPVNRNVFKKDPAPGAHKVLSVEYSLGGTAGTIKIAEGKSLNIPDKPVAPLGSLIGDWAFSERNLVGLNSNTAGTLTLNAHLLK